MGWETLGVINPDFNWQNYNVDVIGAQTFKVIQNWGATRPTGPAVLSRYFGGVGGSGARAGYRRVWAFAREPQIIEFPYPIGFEEAGLILFTMQIKLSVFHGHEPESLPGWTVAVQALYP